MTLDALGLMGYSEDLQRFDHNDHVSVASVKALLSPFDASVSCVNH